MKAPIALTRTLLILGVSGLLGCSGGYNVVSPPGGPGSVSVRDDFFTPTPANITAGTTATWSWQGSNAHTVTFEDGQGSSGASKTSGSHNRSFPSAGTFRYRCTVHSIDFNAGMIGSVVVQ